MDMMNVWHTQVVDTLDRPDRDVEWGEPLLECSICFNSYDNVFKTPKRLQCSHTICLECVARLVSTLPEDSSTTQVPCPFCRQPTLIPEQGAPALQTSQETLSILPAHLQHEEAVWIEGTRLCYKQHSDSNPSIPDTCICVDISMTKVPAPVPPAERPHGLRGFCCYCSDWKRIIYITLLLLIICCILLWPVQCMLKTGNLRCTLPPATVPPTTTYSANIMHMVSVGQ